MTLACKIEQLMAQLPELKWDVSAPKLKQSASDFHWFSPILKQQLSQIHVDALVSPNNIEQLITLVKHCVQAKIPMTVRGGGTGNYGQALPLHGGIVIDFTPFNQIIDFDEINGVISAQAGIRLKALEDYSLQYGYELRCKPSTYKIATLGGFFAGGFGGIGSINYGPLNAIGNVLSLRLLTIEESPQIIELDAFAAAEYAHSYGTTGIILDFRLALSRRLNWHECAIRFANFDQAFNCAAMLAHNPALNKKQIAVFSANTDRYFDQLKPQMQAGDALILSLVEYKSLDILKILVDKFSGEMIVSQSTDQALERKFSVEDYCWNHATLSTLRHDKNFTYLQTAYQQGSELEQLEKLNAKFGPDTIIQHVEIIKNAHGQIACSGLPIIAYKDPEQLQQILDYHLAIGVRVNNPHTIFIAEGHHSKLLNPNILKYKQSNDPFDLLNSGKLSASHSA